MYLSSFTARNIKCFGESKLELPADDSGHHAGWHVVLGTNATGKTTLLQAMALALIGPQPAMRLVSPTSWVRRGATHGALEATLLRPHAEPNAAPARDHVELAVVGDAPVELDAREYDTPQIFLRDRADARTPRPKTRAARQPAPFVCGYGSFRRLTGGAEDDLTYEPGPVGRVASLFHESVALKRNLEWLPRLYARSLDTHAKNSARGSEYRAVRDIIEQLLPDPVRIADVDTERVYFSAPGADRVDLLELSDGFRSFLALVIDLLRQTADVFGAVEPLMRRDRHGALHVDHEGVVFIDEVDLHLHPTWQREIGPRLQQVFPRLQFIVSTHSPFIAQSASRDGLFVLRAGGEHAPVRVYQPTPAVSGWTVEQILLSPLFGLTDTRDPETERWLAEHAALRGKAKFEQLRPKDQERLAELERDLAARITGPGGLRQDELNAAVKLAAEKVRGMLGAQAGTPPTR